MLFKVAISRLAMGKIISHTRKPYEQIGLLLGGLEGGELKVTDAIEGEGEADGLTSIFSAQRMAKIAQEMMMGRIQGSIVGWYHSHIGCGVFMSDLDVQTQIKLQQFSPYIIALVIDSVLNEFGVFTYLTNLGVVQLPEEYITIE
jgi:proteasome lid subunit RPN8/RPN11